MVTYAIRLAVTACIFGGGSTINAFILVCNLFVGDSGALALIPLFDGDKGDGPQEVLYVPETGRLFGVLGILFSLSSSTVLSTTDATINPHCKKIEDTFSGMGFDDWHKWQ
jgi:hypothetical protein